MKLVTLDVIHELWRSYDVTDREVRWPDNNWGFDYRLAPRQQRVWRFKYPFDGHYVTGIAAISKNVDSARRAIRRFLRESAEAEFRS